jgi:O-antigen biosynthesis protein
MIEQVGSSLLTKKRKFQIPVPGAALEFTGERFTTLVEGEVRHEHLHRYFFALQFCKARNVLDIASGEGYGSALLATIAARVVGVDVSEEAVRHAAESYRGHNLGFHRGEATKIPAEDASIDVVVSFETLEHLEAHEEFLREIKRVLRPGGVLVMSTPDHEFFAGGPPNPFHMKELVRAGFRELIGHHFKNAAFFVQSSLMGSVIAADQDGGASNTREEGFRRVSDNTFESMPGVPNGMYLLAVASDASVPDARTGSFDDRPFQLGLYAELQRRHEEMSRREAQINHLVGENEAAARRMSQQETQLIQVREEILRREGEAAYLRQEQAAARAREVDAVRQAEDYKSLQARQQETEVALRRSAEDAVQARAEAEQQKSQLREVRERLAHREGLTAGQVAGLSGERDTLRREVKALRDSWSWKISAPFRWALTPGATVGTFAIRALYAAPSFRYLGKPLARLISNIRIPGAAWLLPDSALFDSAFYGSRYPDVARASKNPWAHYLAYGSGELRDPHPLFRTAYYFKLYPDVVATGVNPLLHYSEYGAREGRNPSPAFETSYYLAQYPDVRESGVNPLLHFVEHGKSEGRRASARSFTASNPPPQRVTNRAMRDLSLQVRVPDAKDAKILISVLLPTYNTPPKFLGLAIQSVVRQSYPEWELCIYDDGSSSSATIEALRAYTGRDSRIRIEFGNKNQGIAKATNQALAMASGAYVAMLDHDDEIMPDALRKIAQALRADPAIDALYTDQAYIDADGGSIEPFYKPDWSPEMFRGVMFVNHVLVVRQSLAVALGGFDANFDRVQDFEFMLRVSEKSRKIRHLPKVLYHWRRIPGSVAFHGDEKGPIEPIQAAAVNDHLSRLGISAIASPHPFLAHRLVINPAPRTQFPAVQVVVRETANGGVNSRCIESILDRSTYPNFKVIAVGAASATSFGRDQRLEEGDPAKIELGTEDFILWIDPTLEVLTPDWIECLLLYGEQDGIACVAPMIINEDGTVWHSGLVLGMNGTVGYAMQGMHSDSDGYAGSLACAREVSGVSGECLLVSGKKLDLLGGNVRYYVDPLCQGADLSLRGYTLGLRNIVTPRVVLRRQADAEPVERYQLDRALLTDRWSELAKHGDPFYNPNFSLDSPGYQVQKAGATGAGSKS